MLQHRETTAAVSFNPQTGKKPTKQKHPMNSYLKDLDASRLLEN
jgi:hypothetical protein